MNDRNNQYAQSMFTNMQNSEGGFFNNNPPPKLGEKSITENGTYTAKEDKLDGYSSVTADVAGGGGETFEVEFTMNNDGFSSNKTYSEIMSAINGGMQIAGTLVIPDTATFRITKSTISDINYTYPGGTQTFNNAVVLYSDVLNNSDFNPASVVALGFIANIQAHDFIFFKFVDIAA